MKNVETATTIELMLHAAPVPRVNRKLGLAIERSEQSQVLVYDVRIHLERDGAAVT
jgi:hypothetical protein